ncbi:MAG TPA: hypothetical protein VHX44_18185 [Planctomycetota bacterium]|nr:hypothetical protein [Planctomycetota bacterium]
MAHSTLTKSAPKPKPAERWLMLIDAWRQSDLSQSAYARRHHVGSDLLVY